MITIVLAFEVQNRIFVRDVVGADLHLADKSGCHAVVLGEIFHSRRIAPQVTRRAEYQGPGGVAD